ncbi:unnamed protein product, partial [Mesorhabditis spiculigera]
MGAVLARARTRNSAPPRWRGPQPGGRVAGFVELYYNRVRNPRSTPVVIFEIVDVAENNLPGDGKDLQDLSWNKTVVRLRPERCPCDELHEGDFKGPPILKEPWRWLPLLCAVISICWTCRLTVNAEEMEKLLLNLWGSVLLLLLAVGLIFCGDLARLRQWRRHRKTYDIDVILM